jgi:hypothetical protein
MARVVDRVVAATKSFFDPDSEDGLQARIDELDRAVFEAEREAGVARRAKDQFYMLVDRMQSQRDEYREMFKTAVLTYHGSLSAIEQEVVHLRMNLQRLSQAYNALREEHGQPRVKSWDELPDLLSPPVGVIARDYVLVMKKLWIEGSPYAREERQKAHLDEDRPSDPDGVAERDVLVAGMVEISPPEGEPKKDC